jgi:transposase
MQGKSLRERSAESAVYVGIDVCKDWLDVHLHPLGRRLRVANSRDGLKRLKRQLSGFAVELVVMEATAKFHRLAHRTLHAAGLPVAIVNPLRSRLFAEAVGALAKPVLGPAKGRTRGTDAVDARLLAILGESLAPAAKPPAPEHLEALGELVAARQAATAEATALAHRHGASAVAFLKGELKRRLASLKRHIARLEAEIARRIATDPQLARRYAIVKSIPGIGPVAAAMLIVGLSELGMCSNKAAALLAGLAPIAADSGERTGERHIRGGRASVRTVLYMAALTASRCNRDLAIFYQRLRAAGKKPKVALTAAMRKLVVLANTLITQDRLWQPNPPIHA